MLEVELRETELAVGGCVIGLPFYGLAEIFTAGELDRARGRSGAVNSPRH